MINTILFDMGGTLEDIWYNDETEQAVRDKLLSMLGSYGLDVGCDPQTFWEGLMRGIKKYKAWSESNELEKKPEEIWTEYYLAEFPLDFKKVAEVAEELAGMWEVTYYHRELRPGVKETLEALKNKGYRLGVISNTASLYSVFDVLEAYGIRGLVEDVTLSSVTGYRKPHKEIFRISLRQMCVNAAECCYVGDTVSRDIIGPKRLGFGATVQIHSFLSDKKDVDVAPGNAPDYTIGSIPELLTLVELF